MRGRWNFAGYITIQGLNLTFKVVQKWWADQAPKESKHQKLKFTKSLPITQANKPLANVRIKSENPPKSLNIRNNDVKEWQARRESNPDLWYRKPLFYPLNYRPS